MTDNRYGGFHLCGECGKEIQNGKFCKHEIPKIKEGGRVMADWKLTNSELKKIANCELDTLHPRLACDRTEDGLIDCQHCPIGYYCGYISMAGQKKLLEYLIATTDESRNYSHVKTHKELESMLKQLEVTK
jgi:hypothetical protein